MTDYVERRRAYVSQVRSSFEAGADAGEPFDREEPQRGRASGQLRFLVALLLFLFFFAWDDSGNTVCGVTPAKMIDMIEDNRYDTILQECDAVLAELLHTE